jgi:hypothetical protein
MIPPQHEESQRLSSVWKGDLATRSHMFGLTGLVMIRLYINHIERPKNASAGNERRKGAGSAHPTGTRSLLCTLGVHSAPSAVKGFWASRDPPR